MAGYKAGYTGVDSSQTFTSGTGYGFESPATDSRYGGHPCDDVVDRDDPERDLLRGCVRVANGTRFSVRLPPLTKVRVRVVLSSVPFWYSPGTTHYQISPSRIDDLSISITKGSSSAAIVAGNIDLRTAWQKGSLDTEIGSYRKVWFTGTSGNDGVLRIGFFGPSGVLIPIAAVEVYPFEAAPLVYHRQGSVWLASPTGANVPGLASFHAHDYAAARAAFATIGDPLLRAYAFAFMGGWLDGTSDDPGADLLACESALDDPSLATDPRAIELRDELSDFTCAEKHYRLRGFSWSYPMPPEGEGWFNSTDPNVLLCASSTAKSAEKHYYLAEAIYAQACGHTIDPIVAENAGTHTDGEFEPSPFAFRSLERISAIHLGLNATHGYISGGAAQAGKLAALDLAEAILRAFDTGSFLSKEFAGNSGLASLAYSARPEVHHHSENGGLFTNWDGTDISMTAFDPSKAWWKNSILAQDPDPSVPPWADLERRYLSLFRAGVKWWVLTAAKNHEYGGGFGDDPELAGLLVLPYAAIEHPSDQAIRDELVAAGQKTLNSSWVGNGYYDDVAIDVEHSAEFTTYPLLTSLSLKPKEPALMQRCLDVARHLAAPPSGSQPWTVVDAQGRRFFASYIFNSAGPVDLTDPNAAPFGIDVPLDCKALVPSLLFLGQMKNPTLQSDLFDWLKSWRDEAIAPAAPLPKGLVPAGIRALDHSYGTNGHWWEVPVAPNSYCFPANLSQMVQLYAGFFGDAHDLDDQTPYKWLLPALRLTQGVLGLEAAIAAGQTPSDVGTVGTANWALDQLRASSSFWQLAAWSRPRFATDSYLRTTDDPEVGGTSPYVSDTFLSTLDAALSVHDVGYPTHLAVPQGPIDVQGGQYGRKGKNGLTMQLTRGTKWLTNYFPLATTSVLYTDRAFLFNQSSHQTLYGMLTGGDVGLAAPNNVCTWTTPAPGDPPLDVSILVNDLATGAGGTNPRLRVLLFNFENGQRNVGIRLWHRLPFGQYALRYGEALASTDYFKNGQYNEKTITFDQRGDEFDFPLDGRKLTLLEIEHIGPATAAPGFDLALSNAQSPFSMDSGPDFFTANAAASNFGDASVPAANVEAHVVVKRATGEAVVLDKLGTTELVLPLDSDFTGVSGFNGYDLPSVALERTLPLPKEALALLSYGCRIEITFVSTLPDTDATNDSVKLTFDASTLSGLDPTITLPKAPKKAAKLEKALKKAGKALAKAWAP